MSACDHKDPKCSCPFAFTDTSESLQAMGCGLPSQYDIQIMRVDHNKTWACHADYSVPCVGAIKHLHENFLPHKVVDSNLVNMEDNWELYVKPTGKFERMRNDRYRSSYLQRCRIT